MLTTCSGLIFFNFFQPQPTAEATARPSDVREIVKRLGFEGVITEDEIEVLQNICCAGSAEILARRTRA